ncbi:MAG: hypothetical protein ACREEP_09095, partial [Dongiaceae bacterium]
MKFDPLIVSVKPGPPDVVEAWLILAIEGTGLLIEKFDAFDVPPPGSGLKTVTAAAPVEAMSAAGI